MPDSSEVLGTSGEFGRARDSQPPTGSVSQRMTLTYEQMMGGPLPPPQALLDYESLLPGTANRLLILHEKLVCHQLDLEKAESEHRRADERLELQAGIALDRNGPFFALSAVVSVLGLAAYVTFAGYPQTAGTITTVVVIGLAVAFLTPRLRSEADVPPAPLPPQLPAPPTAPQNSTAS